MKFMLDGCDIRFVAEAPEDITLKQLLIQCDKIRPDYCACGIRSLCNDDNDPFTNKEPEAEIIIDYNSIKKVDEYAPCRIKLN